MSQQMMVVYLAYVCVCVYVCSVLCVCALPGQQW